MANRLAAAASPYLLQHADNPVDWYEWGDEAFAAAVARDVPVLLSVGYAACHWCHVMAHESFEDPPTAEVMNELFVNIKVDREERPDIDRIYMDATQAMTGRGGWPMTVFLTPDARPFFAGTYFPKEGRHGMPSFRTILDAIADAWRERRPDIESQAEQLTVAVSATIPGADRETDTSVLQTAYERIAATFDEEFGGFGGAPKFPQAPVLEFLLRIADEPWAPQAKRMVTSTLHSMARGGIYDQLGGGFARYSVDGRWLVPHFEKMLYDNALLARIYLRAWQVIGDDDLRRVAVETLDYLLADLSLPEGALASSEDADSEGAEGTFYVWGHDDFRAVTGDDAPIAAARFGVTPGGNFEGKTVLSLAASEQEVAATRGVDTSTVADAVDRAKRNLLEARRSRSRPDRDDKAVAAWNGLALRALAEAAVILENDAYLRAAGAVARFLVADMRRPDGRMLRAKRSGAGEVPGFCDDYAATVLGLLAMNQADGDPSWLVVAVELADDMVRLFTDDGDGFYSVGSDADNLIARPKDLMDNPVPSGNSLAAEALFAISHLTGRADQKNLAWGAVRAGGKLAEQHPAAVGHLLAVSYAMLAAPRELAIVGPRQHPVTRSLVNAAMARFRPEIIIARSDGDEPPVELFAGRLPAPAPLAYLCRDFACEAPTDDPLHLTTALET